jgi:hypothetical protein
MAQQGIALLAGRRRDQHVARERQRCRKLVARPRAVEQEPLEAERGDAGRALRRA